MKFHLNFEETEHDLKKRVLNVAMQNAGATDEDIKTDDPKKWHTVKHENSNIMFGHLTGRPSPMKASRVTPNKESIGLSRPPPLRTYPKKLETDKEKFLYLKDLLVNSVISTDIFLDLASLLKVKQKLIQEAMTPSPIMDWGI